jgi:hypothetical protein
MDSEAPNKNVRRLLQGVVWGTKDQGAEETLQFRGDKDSSCTDSSIATTAVTYMPYVFRRWTEFWYFLQLILALL